MFCGKGSGKSSAALGRAVKAACEGKSVIMIQFLKGKDAAEPGFLRRLDPEIRLFSFDKFAKPFNELSPEEREEERAHIQNGLSYARKVLSTGEADVVVLDEILGLPEKGVADKEEIRALIQACSEDLELILTGQDRCEDLWPYVDEVSEVITDFINPKG